MNKPILKNITDTIEFGILEGQTFLQIFRFSYSYLEWVIRKTEICFLDLDEFFHFGKPIDTSKFKKEQIEVLIKHAKENNKSSINGGILIHFENYNYLKNVGFLSFSELVELDYKFPDDIVTINETKLKKLTSKVIS